MENNRGTILQKKKKSVKFSDGEQTLMLRAYLAHPSDWSEIIEDIKANVQQLNAQTQEIYATHTFKQLRDRLSSKLKQLMAKDNIDNQQLRILVDQIRANETRLLQPPQAGPADVHPQPRPNAEHNPPIPANDVREHVAADLPSSSDDEPEEQALPAAEGQAPAAPEGNERVRRKRRRPLSELVRQNHLLYNRFMLKKLPKILREFDISSSGEDDAE